MAEPRRLRLGILGTGNIARQFSSGVRSSDRCELTAVGSRTRAAAKVFATAFEVPRTHGDYEALLNDPDVQAIYVALPNSMHHEWTIKALRAGKHVLCEKPLAVTERQGREMFEAARLGGRVLVEAFMYVSHPQTAAVLKAVRDGVIGQLRLIRTSFCYRTTRLDGNIRFDASLCGGALMDVGCYCTHFARLLAGQEPMQVAAFATLHEATGVDVATSGAMRFASGVLATFSCGMTTQCDNTAHICGTDGYIQIAWPWKPSRQTAGYTIAHSVPPRQDRGISTAQPGQAVSLQTPGDLYALEADDFAAAVLDGAPPRLTEPDTLGNLRVLDEIRRQIGLKY
jgi:predicted dehydrogenase